MKENHLKAEKKDLGEPITFSPYKWQELKIEEEARKTGNSKASIVRKALNYHYKFDPVDRKYGLAIQGMRKPVYFETIEDRKRFIEAIKGIFTYSTFNKN